MPTQQAILPITVLTNALISCRVARSYGDNTTKTCVTTCPVFAGANQWGISFASDQYGICVKTCDPKMTLGGISVDVYYDVTNRKCTTKCPSSEPYSW